MSESTANNYKDTLNLPKTAFEMKANLTQREPAMLAGWKAEGLYGKIRAARKGSAKGKWVLHDGPPYANGDIHMGHLINKVLKDIVVKFRTMEGFDSPYVPGWDCHGLPIESAIQKELGPKFRELSKGELRKKCAEYALKYVKLQGESFQRLGILGEFERPYLTLDPQYEGGILDVLAELVKGDLVYRQKKPVHWCVNDRTALAEAELEYAGKRDVSVYVKFEVHGQLPQQFHRCWKGYIAAIKTGSGGGTIPYFKHPYLMIWTTTPWTIPANRAVAVHPDHEYVCVRIGDNDPSKLDENELIVMAKNLVERVMKARGVTRYEVSEAVEGRYLWATKVQYRHPLDHSRLQPVVLADYVTLEDGTGLVHTAPGHGKEDYQTGMKYGLEVYNPVLADGRYDETVPEFLRGKLIWEANGLVVEKLKELGTLFHAQEFDHEYPHCWRCKKPVIFRATEQWFVKASGEGSANYSEGIRKGFEKGDIALAPTAHAADKYLEEQGNDRPISNKTGSNLWKTAKQFVNDVKWIPAWGKNRIDGMLDTRPDWCISRQRSWGVPIPAFFDGRGRCLLTEASVRRVAEYFRRMGRIVGTRIPRRRFWGWGPVLEERCPRRLRRRASTEWRRGWRVGVSGGCGCFHSGEGDGYSGCVV